VRPVWRDASFLVENPGSGTWLCSDTDWCDRRMEQA
jgi:alpha-D-ribose 1-methylphosphonate 5-phosphate C-P lyase